jgi:hypothetical protein
MMEHPVPVFHETSIPIDGSSKLDFSHLVRVDGVAQRPYLKEWPSPGGQDAPANPSGRRSSQRPERANRSLLARLPGSDSRSLRTPCPVLLSCAREEEAISAREGF